MEIAEVKITFSEYVSIMISNTMYSDSYCDFKLVSHNNDTQQLQVFLFPNIGQYVKPIDSFPEPAHRWAGFCLFCFSCVLFNVTKIGREQNRSQ